MLITDVREGEPDLIAGNEYADLEIRSLSGLVLARIAAGEPWTHVRLVKALEENQDVIDKAGAADFYLWNRFIGSTEV